MNREPIGTGRLPPLGGCKPSSLLFEHRSRSPDPSKTHPRHGAMVAGLGAIGRRCGSAMAWRPPL
jgi:hypothetical protein